MKPGSAVPVAYGALIAALVILGVALPVYWVHLLSTVAISALVARSIGLVTNQAGLVALCQMSFAAIGGWVVSWVALTRPDLPMPLLLLIGGLAAGLVGLLIGVATIRVRGVEFAVVTLGFAAALDLMLRQGAFPGVGAGTPVIPAAPFDDPRGFFALAWVTLLVVQLGIGAMGRTRHGLAWHAVRGSERAAAALGVRAGASKAAVVTISALTAGLAGGLLAGQYGLLTPQVFSPLTSMVYLVTAVLCGASLFSGALLSGVFAVFVPELLRRFGLPLDVAQGLLALAAFDVLRRGNGGIAEQLRTKLQERAFRESRLTCELNPLPEPATGAAATSEHCLEVSGLTVAFGGPPVLTDVDLTVRRGEVHALIGPNGAGKTTLVDAVTGFLPRYEGIVCLDGSQLDGLTVRARFARGIRRTFQQPRGIEAMTVDDYLRLAGGASSADRAAVREFFGLPGGRVPIRLMDVGSRRILEIAGTVISKPQLVLLDEPAAGLDGAESQELAERVRRMPEQFGCAVLLIEHDMGFVRACASHATVLDAGRVIGAGSVGDVLSDPRVAAAYLGTGVVQ